MACACIPCQIDRQFYWFFAVFCGQILDNRRRPSPLDPLSHVKRHAGEGISPALPCYENVRRNASFEYFSHPALMTAPSPFFRRGDQGVRSSGAVDSPDFQKNTCVRDGHYAFTHTNLRSTILFLAFCERCAIFPSSFLSLESHESPIQTFFHPLFPILYPDHPRFRKTLTISLRFDIIMISLRYHT